jgi:hypothetical protein
MGELIRFPVERRQGPGRTPIIAADGTPVGWAIAAGPETGPVFMTQGESAAHAHYETDGPVA